jgi:hypothetical protein
MALGVAFDLIVIPWPYLVAHYLRKKGDRWRDPSGVAAGQIGPVVTATVES